LKFEQLRIPFTLAGYLAFSSAAIPSALLSTGSLSPVGPPEKSRGVIGKLAFAGFQEVGCGGTPLAGVYGTADYKGGMDDDP